MLAFIRTVTITTTDCIRCTATIAVTDDTPRIAVNAETRSPLRPNGTLTGPDDPDFAIANVCPPCDAVTMILADEIRLHKDDLITYFKVVFPHGRYDLITRPDTPKSTIPQDEERNPEPTPANANQPRTATAEEETSTSLPEHTCVYENGSCIFC